MLNPNLDRDSLAAEFRKDDRVRVLDVLDREVAEKTRQYCADDLAYKLISFVDDRPVEIPEPALAGLSREQRDGMEQQILQNATRGIGYAYGGYRMGSAQDASGNPSLGFLHSVFDFLNSRDMLDFVSAVSGRDDLLSADAQYTRYLPGQFLTRHRDDAESEQRRLAYVISLSPNWHPDWGGLLQFFTADGEPRDAWTPTFNSMSLFDVRHVHSVTYVTPFAGQPRLSLTGWFRAKPW